MTPAIEEQWNAAHRILSNANHIRVIGYSLPVADAYVKYLLKSAVLDSRHLKTIDILLLDPSLNAISRYREFVTFKYARVANVNVKDYLTYIANEGPEKPSSSRSKVSFSQLETLHESFMAVHAKSLS